MEIIVRATALFFFVWGLMRVMGKRELAELTAFELVLLISIGDLIQQGVTQEDMSITGALLAVGTIGMWILAFSYASFRWRGSRSVIEGFPVVVVQDGRLLDEMLRLEGSPQTRCSMPPGSRGSKTWTRSGSASSRPTGSSLSSRANATPSPTGERSKGYMRSNRMARLTSWMAFVTWIPRGQASVQLNVVRHRNTPVRSPSILRRSSAPRSRESKMNR